MGNTGYDPDKPGDAGYWDYPTKSNTAPSNVLSSSGTNNANFYNGGYTIGSPYYRTPISAGGKPTDISRGSLDGERAGGLIGS